jgi:hypothetical protein
MIPGRTCVLLLASALVWLGSVRAVSAQGVVWTTHGPEGGNIQALAIDPQTTSLSFSR